MSRTARTARTARRASVLAAGITLLTASVALAHPSFNPNQVPGGEMVESTLVIPHGCNPDGGMPDDDGATATTLFELQLTDAVAMFEAREVEGWSVSRDGDVVTWEDAGGATTEPIELPVAFDVTGEADEELYLSAYQACADGGEFRWIGTPDQEADFPAVKLTLTSGAVGTEEVAGGDHAAHGGDASEGEMDHSEMEGMSEGETDHSEMGDMTEGEVAGEGDDELAMDDAAEVADGASSLWAAIGVLVLVVTGIVLWRRRPVA